MKQKIEISDLGGFNLKIRENKSLSEQLTSTYDLQEQKKILLDADIHNMDIISIVKAIKDVPGNGYELHAFCMEIRPEIYEQSLNIIADAIYINNFKKRIDVIEDTMTKRGMYGALQDIIDRKYLLLSQVIVDKHPHVISTEIPEVVVKMYKNFVEMFKNHKRTLVTVGKIYPMVYGVIEDEDLLKIIVTEQIADAILDNIDPKFVVNVLWKYAGAMHEYGVNDLKWLSEGETEHYAIKILYGISDIRQLREFLLSLKSLITNSISCEAQKDVVRTVIKTLNSIIDESISEEIEVDKDISFFSLEELFEYIQQVASDINVEQVYRDRSILPKTSLRILDDVAEYLNSYIKIYSGSTMYIDNSFSNTMEEFITLLLFEHSCIDTSYKHIMEFIENCRVIVDSATNNIDKIFTGLLNNTTIAFERGVKEWLAMINDVYKLNIIKTVDGGFLTKDGEVLSYTNIHDHRIRKLREWLGDQPGKYVYDPRFASNKSLFNYLYTLSDLLGVDYDGHKVNEVLVDHILSDNNNPYKALYDLLLGVDSSNVSVNKLKEKYAYLGNRFLRVYTRDNKEHDIPSIEVYSPLDIMYDLSCIDISVNNSVDKTEDENPMFLENLDFSEYDFGDTFIEKETVDTLYVYNLLKKIKDKEVNILFTPSRNMYRLYMDIFDIIHVIENI